MAFSSFDLPLTSIEHAGDLLKEQAFEVLETKCNVCHRRQNPFMVFKLNNMDKRAPRIYRAVFVQKRMPKGNDIRLTAEEYAALEQWLKTKIDS